MRKIREMMESCSHTEYRRSFYLTLHSEGLLFHGPPYLILLLPPRLPLLLVHKPLPENLAMEKRRRVKKEASGYRDSRRGAGGMPRARRCQRSPSRLSVPSTGTAFRKSRALARCPLPAGSAGTKGGPNPLGRRGTWRRVALRGRLAAGAAVVGWTVAAEPAALGFGLRTLRRVGSERVAQRRGNSCSLLICK